MSDQSPNDPPPSDLPHDELPPGIPLADEPPPSIQPTAFPERARAEPVPRRGSGLSTLAALLSALVLAALVAAVVYLYVTPAARPVMANDFAREQARIADLTTQVKALSARAQQVASPPAQPPTPPVDLKPLEDRVAALEGRPEPPPPADLKPLQAKVAALEARPTPQPPPPVDLKPLEAEIAALQARPQQAPVDLKPLEAKIAALEARPVPPPAPPAASPADLAALAQRFDELAAQQKSASGREVSEVAVIGAALAKVESRLAAAEKQVSSDQGAVTDRLDKVDSRLATTEQQASSNKAAETGRLDKMDTRLAAIEHTTGQVAGLTATAQRLGHLQGAAAALDAGQPLGTIPDAPPALARFATKPPPTMSDLRLSFPGAAKAAHAASQPAITQGQPFLDRLWTRAQQSVTVREGTRVVLGDPVAGVLAQAQHSLDAGDLAGSVQALDGLAGPAAAAIKPWRDQAQSLLDARAALAKLSATEG